MTPELTALTLAALLQVIQFVLMAVPANLELGPGKTMSPRDPQKMGGAMQDLVSPGTGRLARALNNHFEGLILFAIAVLVLAVADKSGPVTIVCSWLYLGARVLYIPAYIFGWVPWRSLIWLVGLAATTMLLITALTWQG